MQTAYRLRYRLGLRTIRGSDHLGGRHASVAVVLYVVQRIARAPSQRRSNHEHRRHQPIPASISVGTPGTLFLLPVWVHMGVGDVAPRVATLRRWPLRLACIQA